MSPDPTNTSSFLEFEESIVGKPGAPWVTPGNKTMLSLASIAVAFACGIFVGGMLHPHGFFELVSSAESGGASSQNAVIYGAISAAALVFAWWVTLTALIKWTPGKDLTTPILGITTAWIIVVVVRGLSHFILVEADWDVVWANRVLLVVGQQMTEQMTQAPGSESCIAISNCYGVNQNWRLWWILYPTFAVIAGAYGTTADKPARFLVPFTLICAALMAVAYVPSEINYHREVPLFNLAKAMLIGYAAYGASFYYCSISEEYKANRLRSYISIGAVITFFYAILIMDPPEFVKSFAEALGGTPAQEMREAIIAGEVVPSTLDKLAGDGIEASQWGCLLYTSPSPRDVEESRMPSSA